jgi:hypothetical protein
LVLALLVVLSTTAPPILSGVDGLSGGQPAGATVATDDERTVEDVSLVSVGRGGDKLWPYTSRATSFDTLTLPINLVVKGNPARVRSLLLYSNDAAWDETNESWQVAADEQSPGDGQTWGSATGADRYTYVQTESGGTWIRESMQLHDGTYFGGRTHLRLYGGGQPGDSWTAIQAHRDYWDWFRLRHTVTSLDGPRHTVERDLMGDRTVVDVQRERFGNGGIIDADGWVTVVVLGPPQLTSEASFEAQQAEQADSVETERNGRFADVLQTSGLSVLSDGTSLSFLILVLVGVGGVVTAATRWNEFELFVERAGVTHRPAYQYLRGSLLFVTLLSIPLVVRFTSLGLEGIAPNHPKVIAGLLYPVFALGPPIVALRIPRGFSPEAWFVLAFVGYGTGLVADFIFVGVPVVPLEIVLHRFVVLSSLGFLAMVGQRRSTSVDVHTAALPVAMSLWVFLLAWPLLLGI